FRLNGISLVVPPLRERPLELRPLARAFAAHACRAANRPEVTIAEDAYAALLNHPWPGNVRELRNVIERAVLLCAVDVISAEHIAVGRVGEPVPAPTGEPAEGTSLTAELATIEKARIVAALAECNGSQKDAAKLLGISRRALSYKLDVHGLPRPRKGTPNS